MRHATVLLVEDDPTILQLLETCFQMDDFEVLRAKDGSIGLELALACRPDVIVSDISMPNMSGIEMMNALKRDPTTASIPIVLLSAGSQPDIIDLGFAAGADRLVPKPFEPIELIDVVDDLLRADHAVPSGDYGNAGAGTWHG